MAVNVSKLIAAGFDRVYYGVLDSTGYVFGTTGVFAATAAGMAKLDGVKTSDVSIPEPSTVPVTGDDSVLGQFIFAPTALPSFTITCGVNDLTAAALGHGTLTYNDGDTTYGVLEPSDPVYADMCLILMRRAQSQASGSVGSSQFEGIVIPKCQIVPLGSTGFTEREAASFSYRVNVSMSSILPWGRAINSTDFGASGAPIIPFSTENRLHVMSDMGNGTATDTVLTYTPASTSLSKCRVYVDGVVQTSGITVTVATKTVSFAVAPLNNTKIEIVYEHVI